jgi:exosortase/archaeosortase family protein
VWRLAPALRRDPTPGWLALALGMSVAATLAVFVAPPLVGALWAALALACGLRAFLPPGRPILPLAGLAVLALPVVSSLQFYAGYPLRVATAELSSRLLQLAGWAAARTGSAMEVEGRLVIVDAPCSGVQMAWMAYFTACAAALAVGLGDGRFARRLPALGLVVLAGNVVRNTVLVAAEARGMATPALHEGVGLAVLGAVCATVAMLVIRGGHDARA